MKHAIGCCDSEFGDASDDDAPDHVSDRVSDDDDDGANGRDDGDGGRVSANGRDDDARASSQADSMQPFHLQNHPKTQ